MTRTEPGKRHCFPGQDLPIAPMRLTGCPAVMALMLAAGSVAGPGFEMAARTDSGTDLETDLETGLETGFETDFETGSGTGSGTGFETDSGMAVATMVAWSKMQGVWVVLSGMLITASG